jgi:hypothetical protein
MMIERKGKKNREERKRMGKLIKRVTEEAIEK